MRSCSSLSSASGRPAGKAADAHLAQIQVPVLCLNGNEHSGASDLMERAVRGLTDLWTLHWLEAADHSFHVLKTSGRSDAEVLKEIGDVSWAWEASLVRTTV
jgi:predicted alpha/beta-hydrolase family hydrolase